MRMCEGQVHMLMVCGEMNTSCPLLDNLFLLSLDILFT